MRKTVDFLNLNQTWEQYCYQQRLKMTVLLNNDINQFLETIVLKRLSIQHEHSEFYFEELSGVEVTIRSPRNIGIWMIPGRGFWKDVFKVDNETSYHLNRFFDGLFSLLYPLAK